MRHLQATSLIIIIALVGASCSATPTIYAYDRESATEQSAPESTSLFPAVEPAAPVINEDQDSVLDASVLDASEVDPSETGASETGASQSDASETDAGQTAASQAATSQAGTQEKNEAAPYDLFVMETFDGASDRDLGVLNFAVSGFCLGVLNDELAKRLPIDQQWMDPLTSIDDQTCEEIEVHEFLIQTEPTGATTWEEAVRMRFERVVWWGDVVDFANQAIRVCNDLPSSLDFDPGFELSASAEIELRDMMSEECSLLFDDPASAEVMLDTGEVDLDFWVYYTAFGAEVDSTRQPRDLWRVHAATGEQQKLVDVGANEDGGIRSGVAISPDRSRIAYAVNEPPDETGWGRLGLFAANPDGSNPVRIGDVADNSPFYWSDDGTELVANDGPTGERKFIVAFDIQDLSKRVVAQDPTRDLWLRGVIDGSIYYSDNDGNNRYRFYQADLKTGEELDVLDVGFVGWRVDPISRTAVFSDSSQEDIGRVGMIDLGATPMRVIDVPTPHGFNKGPQISPDREHITFANGLEQFGDATSLVAALDSPDERLDIESVFTSGEGGVSMWTPDSSGLIITNGEPYDRDNPRQMPTMYVVSLDLELIELGEGRPVATLAE